MVMSRFKLAFILTLVFIAFIFLILFFPITPEEEQELDPMQDEVCFLLEHASYK